MSLQQRVLEVIGNKAVPTKALYEALGDELAGAVDFALRGLMKDGRVTLELGHYQRTRPPQPEPPAKPPEPDMRRCRRCTNKKPLTDFPVKSPSTGSRLKTCAECIEKESGKPLQTVPKSTAAMAPAAHTETVAPLTMTLSNEARAWLIEQQRQAAERVQALCQELSAAQEELQRVEEVVRVTGRAT